MLLAQITFVLPANQPTQIQMTRLSSTREGSVSSIPVSPSEKSLIKSKRATHRGSVSRKQSVFSKRNFGESAISDCIFICLFVCVSGAVYSRYLKNEAADLHVTWTIDGLWVGTYVYSFCRSKIR